MKLNFALVGCGRIGQRHAKHMANFGNLIGVCDIIIDRAESLGNKYHTRFYDSIDRLLTYENNIDLIAVCTPNGLHAEHTISALKKGIHVLCEKPMAINSVDCQLMIDASIQSGKKLFVVKQNRYNPPVTRVKEIIEKGILGKILNVQLSCFWNRDAAYYNNPWKGTKDLDGGTLFTQFSHFIDLLLWMIGDISEVKAFGKNFLHQGIVEFEDTGVVIIKFKNGALGTLNYTVNSHEKNMEGSLTIFGERGTVKIGGQYLNELEYQNIKCYKMEDLPEGNRVNDYGHYQGSMSNHEKVYENVVEVLLKGGDMTTSGEEGKKTVEVIERIYKEIKGNS